MTEEELDILASSYLDGEATPEEVAMVERGPELRRRVQELRAVQAALAPMPAAAGSLKEQHVAAALAAFGGDDRRVSLSAVEATAEDASMVDLTMPGGVEFGGEADAESGNDSVIDLRSRRSERQANRMRWMSAAAAFVVFGFGAVFLATQMNSANDSFETSLDAADAEASEESAEAVADLAESDDQVSDPATATEAVAAGDEAEDSDASDDAGTMASEPMEADAEGNFATTTAGNAAAGAVADAEDTSAEPQETPEAPPPIVREDLPDSGFFPDEPVVSYSSVPTGEEIVNDLSLRWRDIDFARCATQAPLGDGAEVIAYLPIEVTAADGTLRSVEALYVVVGNEVGVVLVNPDSCELF